MLAMSFVLKSGFPGGSLRTQTIKAPVVLSLRTYASKNKAKAKLATSQSDIKGSHASPTSGLIPTSQRALADETAQAEYEKASTKMVVAVGWLRKEVAGITARATGHVTPAILDPIKVILSESKEYRLEEVATVGVRDGANLIVTLYEDNNLKYVEKAIYAAKLPNVIPQKLDGRTLKIVIPRPTMETRVTLLNTASETAEDTRVQIRKLKDASMRKFKWKPRSEEGEQFQKLCDIRIKEIDQILAKAKQDLGS